MTLTTPNSRNGVPEEPGARRARSRRVPIRPILLVDDDPDERFLSQRALMKAGLAGPFVTAADGNEAIRYLRNSCPAAHGGRGRKPVMLFLDIKMPGGDGFAVLRWIRRKPAFRKTRVIMLSNSNHAADRRQALEFGADAYVVKHGSVATLADTLKDILRRIHQE